MQVDDIRRLVKIFQESNIEELEIAWGEGRTIRMTRRLGGSNGDLSHPLPVHWTPPPPHPGAAEAPGAAMAAAEAALEAGLVEIRSPMVGTFYRASSPGASPYVEVGSRIEKGQVVCLVEAMKLMNEIEAEISGSIVRVLVDNAQPVEFNQPLFLVRPD